MFKGNWWVLLISSSLFLANDHLVQAEIQLPIQEEVPEEVLRTEIIFEARSPLDGQPLEVSEYAALQADLQMSSEAVLINSELREIIFLLQLRRAIRSTLPFLP